MSYASGFMVGTSIGKAVYDLFHNKKGKAAAAAAPAGAFRPQVQAAKGVPEVPRFACVSVLKGPRRQCGTGPLDRRKSQHPAQYPVHPGQRRHGQHPGLRPQRRDLGPAGKLLPLPPLPECRRRHRQCRLRCRKTGRPEKGRDDVSQSGPRYGGFFQQYHPQ